MDALIESLKMTDDGFAMLALMVFGPVVVGLGWAWAEEWMKEWRGRKVGRRA
jgi:hypothetical protein